MAILLERQAEIAGGERDLDGEVDDQPQQVEIGVVNDAPVEEGQRALVERAGEKQAGNGEEVRHAERRQVAGEIVQRTPGAGSSPTE